MKMKIPSMKGVYKAQKPMKIKTIRKPRTKTVTARGFPKTRFGK